MNELELKQYIAALPKKPGVYRYYDKNDVLIYIGKAKNLKNRVSSYFNNDKQLNAKTRLLVRKINRIDFILVETEIDAWLLENNLIKKHKPRYNVQLRDDKTYPWIVIKNEPFPRVQWTRKYVKDGSTYFGPYASVGLMHVVLDVIREIFPLRTCSYSLTQENIEKGKFKICLEYQIGNCLGPCEGLQSEEQYQKSIEDIKNILSGRISIVAKNLKDQIKEAAERLDFEAAHLLKQKLDLLGSYQSKSTVVSSSITNVDVFSIASDEKYAFVNFLKVVNGVVIQTQTIELRKRLDESDEKLLELAIPSLREQFNSTSREVIVPFDMDIKGDDFLRFVVPKQGDKRKLLELSFKNAMFFKKERINQYEKLHPEVRVERLLGLIKKDLRLNTLPKHIECIDNSNIQGNYPVSAVVVFRDAKPAKKEYRLFNIKTVEGPDDYATMQEVVYRRYKRLLEEGSSLPQLLVIDGGKGQLSAALKSLKLLGIEKKLTVIGIAERLEEIYYPGDSLPLYLDKRSESLKVIQHLRDEAHRFGLHHHRNQRSKKTFVSELDQIPGIGKATVQKLLSTFKSVKRVKEASDEELLGTITRKQLANLREYYREN